MCSVYKLEQQRRQRYLATTPEARAYVAAAQHMRLWRCDARIPWWERALLHGLAVSVLCLAVRIAGEGGWMAGLFGGWEAACTVG